MTSKKRVPSAINGSFVRASKEEGTGPAFWGPKKRKHSHCLRWNGIVRAQKLTAFPTEFGGDAKKES